METTSSRGMTLSTTVNVTIFVTLSTYLLTYLLTHQLWGTGARAPRLIPTVIIPGGTLSLMRLFHFFMYGNGVNFSAGALPIGVKFYTAVRPHLQQVFSYFWGDSPRDGRALGVNRGHISGYASCWNTYFIFHFEARKVHNSQLYLAPYSLSLRKRLKSATSGVI